MNQQKSLALNVYQAFDNRLLFTVFVLLAIGGMMIVSTSIPYAEKQLNANPLHFVNRHFIYLVVALVAGFITLGIRVEFWQKYGPWLLIAAIVLLVAVLVIGRSVNGSKRWIVLGPITIQVSELVKLFVITYIAGYLVRRTDELQTQIRGFLKPLLVISLITVLLVAEPDFGAAAVICVTTLSMMFLAGAKLWQFILLSSCAGVGLFGVAISQTYRYERLMVFLDPWKEPFGSGYQLTQSLIAYGRGQWFGEGLGNSVQKLSYLPEAHTDFVFAVFAEEFGFVGVTVVIALFLYLFWRGMNIAREALKQQHAYAAYLSYGISIWLILQALVNIGVSSGALPTKGLTLPFISYGGNSLVVCCVAIAILLRVHFETQMSLTSSSKQKGKAS
ncbi:putative lipid II flippase FtsW [Pleionea mediterranea]|uniref:Probable peptidoglycan glycosyltransferase FtsW n=1 Tax=Pleionea mediterranea TaxID=523701 RepID=A0A316FJR0_9GAMM|nr:putative lipid II flippase FtsW [Pleionea mediterranea]PWK47936.1 cell division-specific peptidoglycan biosynthesis regulator FtsW [Pleionea mediterranea]